MIRNMQIPANVLYIIGANSTILFLALLQNWEFAELFFFLFAQSVLVGAIALSTLIAVSLRYSNVVSTFLHSIFFVLHYYSFIAILLSAVLYDLGDITIATINQGLTSFFAAGLSDESIKAEPVNILPVLLTLAAFTIMQTFNYYRTYKNFASTGRSLAEMHIAPYSKHMFVFFFFFLFVAAILKVITGYNFAENGFFVFREIMLILFFATVTIIEVLGSSFSKTLQFHKA